MAGKGGKIPGQGRKKGSRNVVTVEIKDMIDRVSRAREKDGEAGMARVIDAMFERAIGVTVREPDARAPGGERVYEVAPDVAAAKLLIEMRHGKAKESVEVTGEVDVTRYFLTVPIVQGE